MIKRAYDKTYYNLLGIGWKSKIIFKRATAYIYINKLIVNGCCLEKGKELNCYLAEDREGKKIIVVDLYSKNTNKFKV